MIRIKRALGGVPIGRIVFIHSLSFRLKTGEIMRWVGEGRKTTTTTENYIVNEKKKEHDRMKNGKENIKGDKYF